MDCCVGCGAEIQRVSGRCVRDRPKFGRERPRLSDLGRGRSIGNRSRPGPAGDADRLGPLPDLIDLHRQSASFVPVNPCADPLPARNPATRWINQPLQSNTRGPYCHLQTRRGSQTARQASKSVPPPIWVDAPKEKAPQIQEFAGLRTRSSPHSQRPFATPTEGFVHAPGSVSSPDFGISGCFGRAWMQCQSWPS